MLSSVRIENYRSCYRTSIDFHPNLSVLIGPNSSGKTNILQAIMFLNKMSQEEEFDRFRSKLINVTSKINFTFQCEKSMCRLKALIDAITNNLNIDNLVSARQKWTFKNPRGKKDSFELPLIIGANPNERMIHHQYIYYRRQFRNRYAANFLDTPKWVLDKISLISKFCRGMRYYSASQFINPGACPVSFEVEKEGEYSRPSRLYGHSKFLYDIYNAQKEASSGRYSQFFHIVGPLGLRLVDKISFKEIRTSSIDVRVRVGGRIDKVRRQKMLIVPQFRKGREILSPNQLSEGTFKTLALLFNIITEDSTALLIEEPEVCVHQGLLSSILELIKKYSAYKQMVVSTHSDYVLDHVKPENVFTVRYGKRDGTSVQHIRKTMSGKEYSALRHYLENEGNLGDYMRESGLGR
jgi:hypothetical protein